VTSKRETIGLRLRTARENAGLSQAQVAQKLNMHRPTVSEIEAGRRRVAAEELQQFATAYRVSVGWLTGESADTVDDSDERVRLAARELARMKPGDLERVLEVLASVRAERLSKDRK
jgi:transcriptional regulator with XRE-family HTH domain